MVRKVFVAVVSIGAVLALAGPASAKGITSATFSGPGLPPSGLVLDGMSEAAAAPLWETGIAQDKMATLKMLGATDADLGPGYRAEYRFDFAPRDSVHQTLYPYAQGGPLSYTPPQTLRRFGEVESGWFRGSRDLLAFLVRHGLPRTAPDDGSVVQLTTAARETTGSSMSPWLWVLLAVGGVAVIGGTTVATRRLRRFGSR
ncbi:MAG: hypothetical protein ABR600_06230 [Actinomycetota bacterium]